MTLGREIPPKVIPTDLFHSLFPAYSFRSLDTRVALNSIRQFPNGIGLREPNLISLVSRSSPSEKKLRLPRLLSLDGFFTREIIIYISMEEQARMYTLCPRLRGCKRTALLGIQAPERLVSVLIPLIGNSSR